MSRMSADTRADMKKLRGGGSGKEGCGLGDQHSSTAAPAAGSSKCFAPTKSWPAGQPGPKRHRRPPWRLLLQLSMLRRQVGGDPARRRRRCSGGRPPAELCTDCECRNGLGEGRRNDEGSASSLRERSADLQSGPVRRCPLVAALWYEDVLFVMRYSLVERQAW